MATYFHQNSSDPDGALQTLVLMNPTTYVHYSSDAPPPQQQPSAVFLNSSTAAPPHSQTQQFVGIPLPGPAADSQPSSMHVHPDISSMHGFMPRVQYNLWSSLDPSTAAREATRTHQQQGLSLSLSPQQPPPPPAGYRSFVRAERSGDGAAGSQPPPGISGGEDVRISGGSPSSASGVTNGAAVGSGMQGVLLSSKYLKAAQELLEEVVNVGNNGLKAEMLKKASGQSKPAGESAATKEDGSGDGSGKRGAELSMAERQEIQMKKAKLISMLDEVEQRYKQYHNQMQIVISSFEQAAGIGSARTYTALALQTISKQFRCLKDAIAGQIRAASKSLGEEDGPGGKIEGSRLKFVDHHLRQQRALQQLGMIQQNAWRPQRGLPERSVSILRAWLFEHFLHPYPKDSDKHMLAKQTGLTRSQVSNWFINARVRLWKPMVEEMYLEEVKEQEQNGGGAEDKPSKSEHEDSASRSSGLQDKTPNSNENSTKSFKPKEITSRNHDTPAISTNSASSIGANVRSSNSGFTLVGPSELEGLTQGSPKKPRSAEMLHNQSHVSSLNVNPKLGEAISMKFVDEGQGRDGYSIIGGGPANFIGGFGQYPIGEIGRFGTEQFAPSFSGNGVSPPFSGNGVSLTLGLPHSENLSLSGAHQSFLPSQNIQLGRRVDIGEANEFGAINAPIPHSSSAYETMNIQNRKRFPVQLLPDFVA
ncbi:BEL1-like homeodomain protein 1 isoform X2 [Syzygium oleosum]|uniref:BEL1-like homeodomain protein 1 isoform X2 n=1 Tax=Syzygium oleosum TaxID=219896 RepID=UPI0011D21D3B|nr:BEL1-like homeodomain protein 1 isoform X2 [Syzygium oleosum]